MKLKLPLRIFIRISYIIFALTVTILQFKTPFNQYREDKTSTIIKVLEPQRDLYPSVTICSGPKNSDILKLLERTRVETLNPSDVSAFLDVNDWNLNLTDIILGVFQEYKDHAPWCDREKNQGRNLVEDRSLWTTSIPHPEKSGKCFTYNPKEPSSPGDCYSLRIGIGNMTKSESVEQMENIKIFLHEKGKFNYFLEQDHMPDSYKIEPLTLKREHATTFKLSKSHLKSLSRSDRECEEKEEYNWGDCLDEMFYQRKGCQDPWNVNPNVPLRVCTNVTEILLSYRQGPPELINEVVWDGKFWDRPYMFERELADITRDGMRCKTPCSQTHYEVQWKSTVGKDKVKRHQYGHTQEWVFGLNLIYTSLHQEQREEFRICDFSCLLSSAGGYIGLFFGISIFDLIFSLEWIFGNIYSCFLKRPKKKPVRITSILVQ